MIKKNVANLLLLVRVQESLARPRTLPVLLLEALLWTAFGGAGMPVASARI